MSNTTKLGPDDYRGQPLNSRQGQPFVPWDTRGFLLLEVLSFLNGETWNEIALGYVHSLRPSHIRVVRGGTQMDAQTWRVTVHLNKDDKTIDRITQEVQVGLPDQCAHGQALQCALSRGMDSPQVAWHAIEGGTTIVALPGQYEIFKTDKSGKKIPYPKSKQPKKGKKKS